jgi:protein SCO1/2
MKAKLLVLLFSVLLTACSAGTQPYGGQLRGAVLNPPRQLNDFTAMSTTGEEFTLSDHRGEVTLLYFGYRACPDFCPTTFAELRRVYAALDEPADKLNIVFVTVDPEADTIENLSPFVAMFHKDFIGLRTEGQALTELESQFGVVAQRRALGETGYAFDHNASVFLIGAEGQLEVQYLYGTDYMDIVHDLQIILATL